MTAAEFISYLLIACGALFVTVAATCGLLAAKQKISARMRAHRDRWAREKRELAELRADMDAWDRGVRP